MTAMLEQIAALLWPFVTGYAVFEIKRAVAAFNSMRPNGEQLAQIEALASALDQVRTDLARTTRVASSASLAAGLKDEAR